MRCKLALVPRVGEDVIVEEVELAEPYDDEVRIKVMTCTICHSDIHGFKGEFGTFDGPGTSGHEIAGIVDKVGAEGDLCQAWRPSAELRAAARLRPMLPVPARPPRVLRKHAAVFVPHAQPLHPR